MCCRDTNGVQVSSSSRVNGFGVRTGIGAPLGTRKFSKDQIDDLFQ